MKKKKSKPEVLILTEESLELWSRLFHQALFRMSRGVFKYAVTDDDLLRRYSAKDYMTAAKAEHARLITQAYCGVALEEIEIAFKDEEHYPVKVVNSHWREDKLVLEVAEARRSSAPSLADFLTPLEKAEKRTIEQYMILENGVKNRVRKCLGITVNTLNAKLDKYGIHGLAAGT